MGRTGVEMSDETKEEIAMAECGACRAIVPLNSDKCPECSTSFSGVSDESLGECGACNGLVALDSTKCTHCGTIFVADDVVAVLKKWLEETGITIPLLFKKFDTDGDGQIDSSELKSGLLSLNLADLPPSQVERLIKTIDEDGDGKIDLGELHETITGEKYTPEASSKNTTKVAATEEKSTDAEEESTDAEEDDSEKDDSTDEEEEIEDQSESPFYKMGVAALESGMSIRDIFDKLDSNEDGRIDGPELQKGIEEIAGESLTPAEVMEILNSLDEDSDSRLDPMELIHAIESLDLGISPDDEDGSSSESSVEEMNDIIDDIEDEEFAPLPILQMISDAMDESGDTPSNFFNALDKDGDGQISVEEFTSSIEELIESEVAPQDIEAFLATTDGDEDGMIDIIEFVTALEALEDADEATDDEARLSKADKPFPTNLQRKMMGKQWNDIVWPLIHLMFGLFIAAWLLNGMGGIGPLSVDGSGGNVVLETSNQMGLDTLNLNEGDVYPCDSEVQVGECRNSLTPFSGESSSMPAGFYWDGILLMVMGGIGMISSLAIHLAVVPGWRARAKAMKEVEDDSDEARSDDSEETDEEAEDEDSEAEDGEETEDDDEESADEEDEESESDDDDIDIGSHVGLSLEDEEVFGVIIEFDDKEETVTIKEDGTGDLVTGYQEDMFME